MEGVAQQRAMQSQQGSTAILFNSNSNSNSNLNRTTCLGDEDNNRKQSCMLNLFRADQTVSPDSKALQRLRDEHGFAFDNPYFRDEPSNQRYLRNTEQQQQHEEQKVVSSHVGGGGLLQTATNGDLMNGHNKGLGDGQQLTGNEQLHFIEHHISNLHNRQVTSSVKELSILGKYSIAVRLLLLLFGRRQEGIDSRILRSAHELLHSSETFLSSLCFLTYYHQSSYSTRVLSISLRLCLSS